MTHEELVLALRQFCELAGVDLTSRMRGHTPGYVNMEDGREVKESTYPELAKLMQIEIPYTWE